MPAIEQLQLNDLINQAIKEQASSIYFNISNYPTIETFGSLKSLKDKPILTKEFLETIASNFLSDNQRKILDEKKELKIGYDWSSKVRLVLNFFYQKQSLSISIKMVPAELMNIDDFEIKSIMRRIVEITSGLVIVCGPASSGRSMTILSILDYINKYKEKRIVTIEEPIEYQFINNLSIINQREVGLDVESFEEGLKNVIDENVDVVYVSKIQSQEEINIMLQVASSGKLVLAIMDSESMIELMDKIYGSFDISEKEWAKSLVAESLKVVINQRMLQKIGGGQIAVAEILTMTPSSKPMIKLAKFDQLQSIMQTSKQEGMQDLESAIRSVLQRGIIRSEEAKKYLSSLNI